MSESSIIQVVSLGAAAITGISTIIGVLIANKASLKQLGIRLDRENEKDRSEALRVRVEELYTLVEKWSGAFIVHHATYRKVMYGELTYNQALDITIGSKTNFDTQRLFTLAELYFTESHKTLHEIKTIRNDAEDIQEDYKRLYKIQPFESPEHAKAITDVMTKFNSVIDKYKSELTVYIKSV